MKKRIRQYLLIDTKQKTATEYFIDYNDFGVPYVKYSRDIIAYGECKKYCNPFLKFCELITNYRADINNELCEYIEDKKYSDMIELFKNMF